MTIAAGLTVVAALAAGCTSGPAQEIDPSWTAHTLGPVTVHAPAEWEELASTADNLTVGLPGDDELVRPGVSVTVLAEPAQDAPAEAKSLATRERATRGAQDITITDVDLAGATAATEVAMWSELPTEGGPSQVRSRWVVADLDSGEQVLIGVLGPREEYEALPLDEVLDTVELGS